MKYAVTVEIGGIGVSLHTGSAEFAALVEERYAGFVNGAAQPQVEFEVELVPPGRLAREEDVQVSFQDGQWSMRRADFVAKWELESRRGTIRQSLNPYSLDSLLRIVHTLLLAREGGFLFHAASALRHGRAFLFAGVSGAGKTTMARLAPPDATLLTDEISYVRCQDEGYRAFGTPFAGELARVGVNVSAPLAAVYLLEKGSENRIAAVPAGEAVRRLLRNVLFFAHDSRLVQTVMDAVIDLVSRVPVQRLVCLPEPRVWELIQ